MVRTGDEIVLSDGGREKTFVVLGFTKFHACLADIKDYKHSIKKHGKYCRMEYGFSTCPMKTSGVRLGFWKMLKSVNGKQYV